MAAQLQEYCISDEKTEKNAGQWHSDNNFFIPVNYLKPIINYTKQNDTFQLTKTPEKNTAVAESPYSPRYYGCITPIEKMVEDIKNLFKTTRKLLP